MRAQAQARSAMAVARVPVLSIYRRRSRAGARPSWGWRLQSANRKVLAVGGEGFTRKRDALRAAVTAFLAFRRAVV